MKKKSRIIIPILILAIVLITTGVTLAFFNYTGIGFTENRISTGAVKFHYDEKTHKGAGITLIDAFPADSNDDEKVGNKYFEFRITGKTGAEAMSYVVTAKKSSDSDNIDNIVDMYLTELNNNIEEEVFGGINKYTEYAQYKKINNYTEKVIYTDTIEANTNSYDKTYRLRMWIDEKTNFSAVEDENTGELVYPYENKTFKLNINVYTDTDIDDYQLATGPGLYDSNNHLLANWDTLVNTYGLDVEKDYELNKDFISENHHVIYNNQSMYGYIIEHNPELANGTNLVIGDVLKIGSEAFSNTGLTSITIPASVTTIGEDAFSVTAITNLVIPAGVTTIGDYAFEDCDSLTSVTISSSVTTIGDLAFEGCESLTSVTFESGSQLETIGEQAFDSTALTSITIPASVTTIGDYAFETTAITSITIPASVTTIGDLAFEGCESLTSVTFESGSQLETIGEQAFDSTAITSITIPASVNYIGPNAFGATYYLDDIVFENPNGWKAGGTNIASSDLANSKTASTYLKETYKDSAWTRTSN